MKSRKTLKEFILITFATLIVACAVFFFLIPSQVSVGSISGLAMVLANVVPLNISVITFLLNGILLIIGFMLIGPEFGIKTVYTSLLLPLFLAVFEVLFPDFSSINGDPMLDTVCYIFVVSIGLAILFKQNASSGGLDIVAKLLNKYLRMDLGKAMALPGMCVALSSVLFYDKKLVGGFKYSGHLFKRNRAGSLYLRHEPEKAGLHRLRKTRGNKAVYSSHPAKRCYHLPMLRCL